MTSGQGFSSRTISLDLEAEFTHVAINQSINQSCLCNEAPVKTLDTEAQVSFPGWQYMLHVHCHTLPLGEKHISTPSGRDNGSFTFETLSNSALCVFPLVDFYLYLFPVIKTVTTRIMACCEC